MNTSIQVAWDLCGLQLVLDASLNLSWAHQLHRVLPWTCSFSCSTPLLTCSKFSLPGTWKTSAGATTAFTCSFLGIPQPSIADNPLPVCRRTKDQWPSLEFIPAQSRTCFIDAPCGAEDETQAQATIMLYLQLNLLLWVTSDYGLCSFHNHEVVDL